MSDRDELAALRRMAELEAKAGGKPAAPKDEQPMSGTAAVADTLFRMLPFNASRNFADFNKSLEGVAYKAGGAVTDVAAKFAPPEVAAGLGTATNVGIQSVPSLLGMGSGAKAAPAMEAGAKKLMMSSLKPTLAQHETGKAARAVDTMLQEGVNVTPGGVQKLRGEIDVLNKQIKAIVATSPKVVDKANVTKALDDVVTKFKNQVNPQSDLASIQKAMDEFVNHPLLQQVGTMPVALAQRLKQGTYKALGSKSYGELKGAEIEAQKALARGLKDEIVRAEPSLAGLNAAESRLLNAEEVALRRVLMDANKNPVGLGTLNPATLAFWMADRSPLVKSLLARGMYKGSEGIPQTGGALAGLLAAPYLGKPD